MHMFFAIYYFILQICNNDIMFQKKGHTILNKRLNGNFSQLKGIIFDQEIISNIEDSFPVSDVMKQVYDKR